MVFDHALVSAGDENEVLDAGLARLIHHMLDQRAVNDRQHFFGHGLGRRQKAGSKPGHRKNGFANARHAGLFSYADRECVDARKHAPGPGVQIRVEQN